MQKLYNVRQWHCNRSLGGSNVNVNVHVKILYSASPEDPPNALNGSSCCSPQCSHCDCALTVKHVLLDCDYYRATRQRFFNVFTLKELFDTVSARDVLGRTVSYKLIFYLLIFITSRLYICYCLNALLIIKLHVF